MSLTNNTTASVAATVTPSSDQFLQDVKRKTVRGALSYFGRTIFLQAIGLVASLLLSKYLGPEEFGVYGFVTQIVGLLVFFSDIGLAAALVQKKQEPTEDDYATAFTVQQLLSWLIVGITVVLISSQGSNVLRLGVCAVRLSPVGCVWNRTDSIIAEKTGEVGNWLALALALAFPLASLKTVPSLQLERKLDFQKLVIPQIVEQISFNVVLIFLVISGQGLWSYVAATYVRSISGVIVMFGVKWWRPHFAWNRSSLDTLLHFGAKFQLNDFLARIKDQFFYLALGYVLPLREFGYISWAKNWSMYPYNLTVQNVMAITFPTFSRLQHDPKLLGRVVEKTLFFISLAIFPILVGMCVFIGPLTVLEPKYLKWQPAVLSLILFTLSIGWGALSTPLINTLNAIGQINTTLKLMLMWTGLTWLLTFPLLWWLGFNGVAWAAIIISFTSILPIWEVKKHIPLRVWDSVWRQLAAAVVMAAVGWGGQLLWQTSWVWFILGSVLTSASYLLTLMLIGWSRLRLELTSLRNHSERVD